MSSQPGAPPVFVPGGGVPVSAGQGGLRPTYTGPQNNGPFLPQGPSSSQASGPVPAPMPGPVAPRGPLPPRPGPLPSGVVFGPPSQGSTVAPLLGPRPPTLGGGVPPGPTPLPAGPQTATTAGWTRPPGPPPPAALGPGPWPAGVAGPAAPPASAPAVGPRPGLPVPPQPAAVPLPPPGTATHLPAPAYATPPLPPGLPTQAASNPHAPPTPLPRGPPRPTGPPVTGLPMPPGMPVQGMGAGAGLPTGPAYGLPPAATLAPYGLYGAQQVLEQFESLSLGGSITPGQIEAVDPAQLPRPTGDELSHALAPQPPVDSQNCHPDNMRLTVNGVPNSTALKARWALPVGVVVRPMADEAYGRTVPVVNLDASSPGIVRCRRCRTYINPFVKWIESGRRYTCNVCAMPNDIPMEYYSVLDHTGRRRDAEERPELNVGTVEYVAPPEYMVRAPMPPVYMFLIDVSYAAVAAGVLTSIAASIKSCLDNLPGEERTMVGFITFDSTIHFYNLKSSLSQPQQLVIPELEEPYQPLPDDLLVNLRDSRHVVDTLLDSLPSYFAGSSNPDSCLGPALQAAFMTMAHVGGKLVVLQTTPPSLGVAKFKNRENAALYGSEREPSLRQPEDPFFKKFAAECSRVQITVDLFSFSTQHTDLASLAAMPRYTCGEVYHHPGFNAVRDSAKLHSELVHNLTRPTAWEAVMRIRCSKGLRISSFHGHFFNRSTDLLALPTCDPDKAFAVQIAHEENVVPGPTAYVQCALLYTNSNGERRIRVHTLSLPILTELADLYKAVDGAATASLLGKLAWERCLVARLDETRQELQNKVVSTLKEFRLLNAAAIRQPNKLIFPETLRYLPLWVLGLTKSAAFRGSAKDVTPDERISTGHYLMAAPVADSLALAYPKLYQLHDPAGGWGIKGPVGEPVLLPPTVALVLSSLADHGAYLLDNGRMFVLWVGRLLSPKWAQEVFGMETNSLPPDGSQLTVSPQDTPMSQRLHAVMDSLRGRRSIHQQCFVVRQGTPMEMHLLPYFVEDRSQGTVSYIDWMVQLHKAIISK